MAMASAHVQCFVYVEAFVLDIIPSLSLQCSVVCVKHENSVFSACSRARWETTSACRCLHVCIVHMCVCHFLSVCGLYFKSYALHGVSVLICTLIFIVKKKEK